MISQGKEAGISIEPSVDGLRASRRSALHRIEAAEFDAEQARIEAKAHTDAAEELMKRADEADAQARKFDAQGNPKKADSARRTEAGLRKLAAKNYGMADTRGTMAAGFELEAYKYRTHATRLEVQIEQKMEE